VQKRLRTNKKPRSALLAEVFGRGKLGKGSTHRSEVKRSGEGTKGASTSSLGRPDLFL